MIRGKAPVFPVTYSGGSVFQPAFDDHIQLRYWSMCNNVGVVPNPVVACAADAMTELDSDQFYTYIVSDDLAPPAVPDVTWLPWGPTSFPITLIFRNLLPENGFTPTGDYVPIGALCNKATFMTGGWKACFAAASK